MSWALKRFLAGLILLVASGAYALSAHATLPAPTAPMSFACRPLGPTFMASSPGAASPLGILTASNQVALLFELDATSPAVDVYIAAELPDQSLWLLNSSSQWLSYPASVVAFRTQLSSAVVLNTLTQNLLTAPIANVPPGTYQVYTIVVPTGTDLKTFQWNVSPYYLWCFTQVVAPTNTPPPGPLPPSPAPTVSLSATPNSIASGGSSTLDWSSTNATSCDATGAWSGAKATSGSESTGVLTQNSSFTLTCTGTGGSANQTVSVSVGVTPPPPVNYLLNVTVNGTGTVSSVPSGINCGSDCNESYSNGTSVTLTATPASGQQFNGWSGDCSGTGSCVLDMSQARSVTANFSPSGVVDLNCTGSWSGSQETRTITAWPYRDCFSTNPVGTRTRLTANNGGAIAWEQGTGWNGQNALRVRPPDGSLGRLQGYAGLGEHNFHAVRTKRLNIRYLFRYNANWAQYAQNTKWDIAIKYDYSNPTAPVRREGCERGIVESRGDPLDTNPQDGQREDFVIKQGVCNQGWTVPNRDGWSMGAGVRENEWISVENEFDLDTGWYRTYITTQDGVFNQSLHTGININTNTYNAPVETVPSPYWWGTIDCSTGCFWGWPDDGGSYPRPADTYVWFSHFVMSNSYIGPPAGFVQ